MADEKKVTIDAALSELEAANTGVEDAQKALTEAEAAKEAKVEQIKTLMDELKAKAKELGVEVVQNAVEAAEAVQEKLDEGKDAFAQEAAVNPNAARRKLRLIWGGIGLVAGLIVGALGGYLYAVVGC